MPRYIDAEKLMRALGIADECKKCTFCIGAICTNESDFVDACTAIAEAPTADVVEVRHGEWYRPREWTKKTYRRLCTNCQNVAYYCGTGDYKFCPNCGARMEASDEEPT